MTEHSDDVSPTPRDGITVPKNNKTIAVPVEQVAVNGPRHRRGSMENRMCDWSTVCPAWRQ